jgi:hypothetical protein
MLPRVAVDAASSPWWSDHHDREITRQTQELCKGLSLSHRYDKVWESNRHKYFEYVRSTVLRYYLPVQQRPRN